MGREHGEEGRRTEETVLRRNGATDASSAGVCCVGERSGCTGGGLRSLWG